MHFQILKFVLVYHPDTRTLNMHIEIFEPSLSQGVVWILKLLKHIFLVSTCNSERHDFADLIMYFESLRI